MEQKNKGCFYVIGDTCVLEKKKTAHFRSKKVCTLNCKRIRAGVAFQRVCKTIKLVGLRICLQKAINEFCGKDVFITQSHRSCYFRLVLRDGQ